MLDVFYFNVKRSFFFFFGFCNAFFFFFFFPFSALFFFLDANSPQEIKPLEEFCLGTPLKRPSSLPHPFSSSLPPPPPLSPSSPLSKTMDKPSAPPLPPLKSEIPSKPPQIPKSPPLVAHLPPPLKSPPSQKSSAKPPPILPQQPQQPQNGDMYTLLEDLEERSGEKLSWEDYEDYFNDPRFTCESLCVPKDPGFGLRWVDQNCFGPPPGSGMRERLILKRKMERKVPEEILANREEYFPSVVKICKFFAGPFHVVSSSYDVLSSHSEVCLFYRSFFHSCFFDSFHLPSLFCFPSSPTPLLVLIDRKTTQNSKQLKEKYCFRPKSYNCLHLSPLNPYDSSFFFAEPRSFSKKEVFHFSIFFQSFFSCFPQGGGERWGRRGVRV